MRATLLKRYMGGAEDQAKGCANLLVLTLPSVSRPQSPPQDLPENAGPAGGFAFAFRQQHFARPRQQDEDDAMNELAASGAREAKEKSKARQGAMMLRIQLKMSRLPSILWKAYHTLAAPHCANAKYAQEN